MSIDRTSSHQHGVNPGSPEIHRSDHFNLKLSIAARSVSRSITPCPKKQTSTNALRALDKRLELSQAMADESATVSSSLLGATQNIAAVKTESQDEVAKLKILLDSKICLLEGKLMESIALQTSITENFECRLSSVEGDLCSTRTALSQDSEYFHQQLTRQKDDFTTLETNLQNRWKDLEAFSYETINLQQTVQQHNLEQKKDMEMFKALFEGRTAVIEDSFDAMADVKVQKGMDQLKLEQQGHLTNLKIIFEQRLCSIESNIDLITIILKRVDENLVGKCQKELSEQAARDVPLLEIVEAEIHRGGFEGKVNDTSITKETSRCKWNTVASTSGCIHAEKDALQFHGNSNLEPNSSSCFPIAEEES